MPKRMKSGTQWRPVKPLPPMVRGQRWYTVSEVAKMLRTTNPRVIDIVAEAVYSDSDGVRFAGNKCEFSRELLVKLRNGRREVLCLSPDKQRIPNQDVFAVIEAADILGVSPRRVRQYCKEGRLGSQQAGWMWLISRDDLKAFRRIDRLCGGAGHRT